MYLLGPRYQNSHLIKLVCRQYNTFQENFVRVNEILREIYWESLRAPAYNSTMIKNPYRREVLRRKFLGRTKEERLKTQAENALFYSNRVKEVEEKELGLRKEQKEKAE